MKEINEEMGVLFHLVNGCVKAETIAKVGTNRKPDEFRLS